MQAPLSSLRTTRAKFPQELFDLFIDTLSYLPESDGSRKRALLACHLVSRAFCVRSRSHLFKHIFIKDTSPGASYPFERLRTLLDIMAGIDSTPTSIPGGINPYIRHFSLEMDHHLPAMRLNDLFRVARLGSIMKQLYGGKIFGVKRLDLEMTGAALSWDFLDTECQIVLHDLCRSPHLSTLYISSVFKLPTTIMSAGNIKHLYLYLDQGRFPPQDLFNEQEPAEALDPMDNPSNNPLKTLYTNDGFFDFWEWKNPSNENFALHPTFSRLTELSAWVFAQSQNSPLQKFLSLNADTLEVLVIQLYNEIPDLDLEVISKLVNLHHLGFTHCRVSHWLSADEQTTFSFPGLLYTLNSLSKASLPRSFSSLELEIVLRGSYYKPSLFNEDEESHWKSLNDILTLQQFTQVSIHISIIFETGAEWSATSPPMAKSEIILSVYRHLYPFFPTLSRRPSFTINVTLKMYDDI